MLLTPMKTAQPAIFYTHTHFLTYYTLFRFISSYFNRTIRSRGAARTRVFPTDSLTRYFTCDYTTIMRKRLYFLVSIDLYEIICHS